MILRRLVQGITEQNWFTVLLEIAIVVVGIYLGLEAGQWNQNREDRRAEIAYLERIAADLDASVLATKVTVEFQTRHAKHGSLVLQALRTCDVKDADRDRIATGIYLVGKYAPATFIRATIQELLSAGRLTIIRNSSLRQTLVEMLQYHEDHLFYMSDVQLRTTPQITYINRVAPIIVDAPIGGGADVTWDSLDADFDTLCSDTRFYSAMVAGLNYTWDSTHSLMRWTDDLSRVKLEVDAELEKLKSPGR